MKKEINKVERRIIVTCLMGLASVVLAVGAFHVTSGALSGLLNGPAREAAHMFDPEAAWYLMNWPI